MCDKNMILRKNPIRDTSFGEQTFLLGNKKTPPSEEAGVLIHAAFALLRRQCVG
jgi:hypothetical protein